MNKKKTLKLQVLNYQKTGTGLEEIRNLLAERIYNYPKRYNDWKEEDCSEFYLYFHPRLLKLIGNFKDKGKPFEFYLYASLNWQYRSFLRKKEEKRRKRRSTGIIAQGIGIKNKPPEPAIDRYNAILPRVFSLDKMGRIRYEAEKKQFLFYTLKKCRFLEAMDLEIISEKTGYTEEWLCGVVAKLMNSLEVPDRRHRFMSKRRNNFFVKIVLMEQKLKFETDKTKKKRLFYKISTLQEALKKMQKTISAIRYQPSHAAIAEATGFPKGTVDSSIYLLRRKLERLTPSRECQKKKRRWFPQT